ncbi:MacB-like periplasmic core domain protein [Candidatus Gugararchaeum adminiculabundum]|nr:MacB-like periplasmic core domain protein [Candidatus Gugararchaeum adminiculabundum]
MAPNWMRIHIDLFQYAVGNMARKQLRSYLTIIGIVVGIAAIVALIAIAQGLDREIKNELDVFGSDTISIMPGNMDKQTGIGGPMLSARSAKLSTDDADAISKINGVAFSFVIIYDRAVVEYRNQNISSYVAGGDPEALNQVFTSLKAEEGRMPNKGETGGALLGWKVANEGFKDKVDVGRDLKIGNRTFKVVGILEKSQGIAISSMDSMIMLNDKDARDVLERFKGSKEVSEINVKISPGADPKLVAERITEELFRRHKVNEDDRDFTVMTAETISQQISVITGLLTAFLGGVAAISLLVGGIGVANTMFMSVVERTQEIGILKSIGARNNAILEAFIIEAALIGLIGGVVGALLGTGVALLAKELGVPAYVSPELFFGALTFSVLIGIVSGYFPAKRAGRMQAVDALRFE